jgi:DNA-binding MarR family transcriptional regulator
MNTTDEIDPDKEQRWIDFVRSISPEVTPESVRLMGEWRRISHTLRQISEASIVESGLSEPQYMVLMSLFINEQIEGKTMLNPSQISKWRGTSRNTISSLIRDLESSGLIDRQLDVHDRRKFNIGLTDNGRAKVSQYAHRQFRIVGGCFSNLTQAEQTSLGDLLSKLTTNLKTARTQLEQEETGA